MKKYITLLFSFCCFLSIIVGTKYYIDYKVFNTAIEPYMNIQNGTLILNFHSVLTEEDSRNLDSNLQVYNVPISKFDEQINYLISNDINIISMDQLYYNIQHHNFKGKNVVITFDDIDETMYTHAYPILRENNIPFTVFLVTSKVGLIQDERKYASWDEIKDMYSSNLMEVGVHTDHMHKKVRGIPIFNFPNNLQAFENDLKISISKIESELNYTPQYFAYPYGYGTPQTDNVLMENNIKMIFSLKAGIVTDETKTFFVPRIIMNEKNEPYIEYWLTH